MTDVELKRAQELVGLAHSLINRPVSTGKVWTKYETKCARQALDALWECRVLLKELQEDEPTYARVQTGK